MDSPELGDDSFDDASNLSEETIIIEIPTQVDLIIGGFRQLICILGLICCVGVAIVSRKLYPRLKTNYRCPLYTFLWTLLPLILIAILMFAVEAAGIFTGGWPIPSDLSCRVLWAAIKPVIATTPGFIIMWLTMSITGDNCLLKCKWFPLVCVLFSLGIGLANSVLPSIYAARKPGSGGLGHYFCTCTIPSRENTVRVICDLLIGYVLPFAVVLTMFGTKLCPEPRLKLIKISLAGVVASQWAAWLPTQVRQVFELGGYRPEGILLSLEALWCSIFVCIILPLALGFLLIRLSRVGRLRKNSELKMVPLTEHDAELYQHFLRSGNGMKRVATIEWGFI